MEAGVAVLSHSHAALFDFLILGTCSLDWLFHSESFNEFRIAKVFAYLWCHLFLF